MDNEDIGVFAIIGNHNKDKNTLLEYIKKLSNDDFKNFPARDLPAINLNDIKIQNLEIQREFWNNIVTISKKENKSNLTNQKRKQYSLILNKTLK